MRTSRMSSLGTRFYPPLMAQSLGKSEANWADLHQEEGRARLIVRGLWQIRNATEIDRVLSRMAPANDLPVLFDLTELERMDSAGAMLLWQYYDRWGGQARGNDFVGVSDNVRSLLAAVGVVHTEHMPRPQRMNPFFARLILLGKGTENVLQDSLCFLSFLGLITLTLWRATVQPWRLRYTSITFHMEEVGLKALPIVGLLSFLIGIVISYQGAQQLQQFGADLYVIDLLGVSVLREIGVLMTAIIVAGRSGSAFTAQLGTMQVSQEIDALRTLGLDPAELLVLPRVIALTLTLPLLSFYAAMMAIFGGAVMCWMQLGISFGPFLRELQAAVGLWTFWVGMIKAPVFAFVIAVVGCYQGFQVSGSAESVGQLTTRSVVHGIFLVILLDAVFSVLFAWLGI